MSLFDSFTVLSIEQATTLPFMTLRLAEEGMRVIRVERPPRGDPNRWVGPEVLHEQGINAYFLPNNLGKESITLNLGAREGRALLHRLIRELPVDVFATNQRARSYQKLGIDYETLHAIKPDLIWVGISGFGPESDEAAYDPILQARSGFMDLTGEPDGDPMVFGLPMVDLGAGEHGYGQVMKALYRRAVTGEGLAHRSVHVPVGGVLDGLAGHARPQLRPADHAAREHPPLLRAGIGLSHGGRLRLSQRGQRPAGGRPSLGCRASSPWPVTEYAVNAGRIAAVDRLVGEIASVTRTFSTVELIAAFNAIGVPISSVHSVRDVCADPLVAEHMVCSRDDRSGLEIAISPPPVASAYLLERGMTLGFPPRLGEHNEVVYGALGNDAADLRAKGVI